MLVSPKHTSVCPAPLCPGLLACLRVCLCVPPRKEDEDEDEDEDEAEEKTKKKQKRRRRRSRREGAEGGQEHEHIGQHCGEPLTDRMTSAAPLQSPSDSIPSVLSVPSVLLNIPSVRSVPSVLLNIPSVRSVPSVLLNIPSVRSVSSEQHPRTTSPSSFAPPASCARKHRSPTAIAKRLAHAVLSPARFTARSPVCASPMPIGHARIIGGGMTGIPSHANNPGVSYPSANRPRAHTAAARQTCVQLHNHVQNNCGTGAGGHSIPLTAEKPQASTSGGAVTMTIQLAEPVLFLQGFDHNDQANRTPAMLRGSLILRIAKPTKIKAITLTFRGKARTEWPEGIPPKKNEYFEEKDIMQHVWPFFHSQFQTAELGHCADSVRLHRTSGFASESTSSLGSAIGHLARSASPIGLTPAASGVAADRRLSLQLSQSRSFSKGDSPNGMSVAQRGYRIFQPGDYVYNFELLLESVLPETIDVDLGSVKYELEGIIERPGAFRPNLIGKKDVILIRCPSETSLECTEPIAISRTWEDQLHYDIVISGKSFPLGSTIPIAFKLTPLAKVRCHRIKVFITENIEYSCRNKKVHRLDPTKKVQLFEKRADGPSTSTFAGSSARITAGGGFAPSETANGRNVDIGNGTDNLLGDLNGELNIGPTEMEFSVQLPGCNVKEKDRIHFDTTYRNIQVHHWIKIVMRLSKADPNDPAKRRHFEISIDSPFHILSCRATSANTSLPAYTSQQPGGQSAIVPCACPPLSRRNSPKDGAVPTYSPPGVISPDTINDPRPIHLLRYPSHNPPPFDYDVAPPPLVTPPPRYESLVFNGGSNGEGLADYFSRLADETAADEDTDEDDSPRGNHRRLMPPLTPGGRAARSMDERRTWGSVQ